MGGSSFKRPNDGVEVFRKGEKEDFRLSLQYLCVQALCEGKRIALRECEAQGEVGEMLLLRGKLMWYNKKIGLKKRLQCEVMGDSV